MESITSACNSGGDSAAARICCARMVEQGLSGNREPEPLAFGILGMDWIGSGVSVPSEFGFVSAGAYI